MKKTIITIGSIILLAAVSYAQQKPAPADTAKKAATNVYVPPMTKVADFSFKASPEELSNFIYIAVNGVAKLDKMTDISAASATSVKENFKKVLDSLVNKRDLFLKNDHDKWVADTAKKAKQVTAKKH